MWLRTQFEVVRAAAQLTLLGTACGETIPVPEKLDRLIRKMPERVGLSPVGRCHD